MELAPIVLFVYNRPDKTKKTLEALKRNKYAQQSDLFIFSDAYKSVRHKNNVLAVREIIKNVEGFQSVTVVESKSNKGLAQSIISGVSKIIGEYGKVIVLEDDIVTRADFLYFMNKSLTCYKNNQKIWSITGFSFPIDLSEAFDKDVYLALRANSWSWATWADRWDTIDWDVKDFSKLQLNIVQRFCFNLGGNDLFRMLKSQMERSIDSWAIRWVYAQFKNKSFTVYPTRPLAENIGVDGTGVHCHPTHKYDVVLEKPTFRFRLPKTPKLDLKIAYKCKKFMDV